MARCDCGKEPVEGMFFVGIGSVDIAEAKSKKLQLKHMHGAFFGDETIIRRRRKAPMAPEELVPTYSARAATESELWFLDPSDFDQVLRENPKNTLRLDMLAAKTEASRGGSGRSDRSDPDGNSRFGGAGERLIVIAGVPFGTPGSTNLLHVVTLKGDELKGR